MESPEPNGEPKPDALPSLRRRALLGAGAGTWLGLGIGLAGVGALVARNQIRHPHRDKTTRPDGRFRRVTIASTHPAHDPVLIVAQRLGVFARYNLDVTVPAGVASGQEAIDQLRTGADAAVAPALSWLPRLLGGLDAELVAGLQSGSARLLVDRRSPIKRIEDLNRRSIGIADASTGTHASADRLFFSVVMRRKGMNPDHDVAWVQMPPSDMPAALAAQRVQAVVGHDPVIWQMLEGGRLREVASSMTGSYGVRVSRVLGVRGDVLRADPALGVQLVLAFEDAATTVARHLDEAASVLADDLPDMDERAVARMLHAEGHSVHPVGTVLREQVAQYIDELKLIGLADDELDSGRLARRFCPLLVHE